MSRAKLEAKEEPPDVADGIVKHEDAPEEPAAAAERKPATAAKSTVGGKGTGSSPYGNGRREEEGFPGKGKGSSPYGKGWQEGFAAGKEKGYSEGFKMGRGCLFAAFKRLKDIRNDLEELEDTMEQQLR